MNKIRDISKIAEGERVGPKELAMYRRQEGDEFLGESVMNYSIRRGGGAKSQIEETKEVLPPAPTEKSKIPDSTRLYNDITEAPIQNPAISNFNMSPKEIEELKKLNKILITDRNIVNGGSISYIGLQNSMNAYGTTLRTPKALGEPLYEYNPPPKLRIKREKALDRGFMRGPGFQPAAPSQFTGHSKAPSQYNQFASSHSPGGYSPSSLFQGDMPRARASKQVRSSQILETPSLSISESYYCADAGNVKNDPFWITKALIVAFIGIVFAGLVF